MNIDERCINTIRGLAIDQVQAANSGHPGTPMDLAPAAYALWNNVLNYDPAQPLWPARDRFVLSGGHASALLYSMIHLAGIKNVGHDGKVENKPSLTLEDLKQFRQFNSKTPGHPEYHHTTGVETTTGPLGQGIATSVGMAIAQSWLAARYNKPEFPLFDYYVYTFCGDGDLMEGISYEAGSLAGHLKLGNLIWVYDRNRISIEGSIDIAFTENVADRFKALGWKIHQVKDANDIADFQAKLEAARKEKDAPSLIILDSIIGYGSPNKAGTHGVHGEPLGVDEVKATKKAYGMPEDKDFYVADGVMEHFAAGIGKRGAAASQKWNALFAAYKEKYPELGQEVEDIIHNRLPKGWDKDIPVFPADPKGIASRASSGKVLNAIAKNVPWMIGGSADLAPSNKSWLEFPGADVFQNPEYKGSYAGRNIHFGVREHAMGAIVNGIAVSGLRAFAAGFFIFSDYMKNPIRLSSLMGLPIVYIFTHDSIGVGEDGPTHQPIEQLVHFRATPGIRMIRPADANEVVEAWKLAMQQNEHPVLLALSRQNLPTIDRSKYASAEGLKKGAYVVACCGELPELILIATGSEVGLAMEAYEVLIKEGQKVRVVSMPSWEIFEEQPQSYRDQVLPPQVTKRIAIEQASPIGWDRYAGPNGTIIAMRSFGASAPYDRLREHFGFTLEHVLAAAKEQLKK
ncbi:transketolase [Commensalibacter oyaizuii]|uniref:Transketolase n=1 Tax=Commensalibacter oyaizuii TaxID=3043873 RepID=A0ABT6Q2S5_9PROT|nr:transketolase [Commensalibacter sp. TBRC 16381]MDI2091395.1 transketolase [Commensalibacter sp. TBRC 16381]